MPILVLILFWVPPIQFELLFLSLMEQTQFFKLLKFDSWETVDLNLNLVIKKTNQCQVMS